MASKRAGGGKKRARARSQVLRVALPKGSLQDATLALLRKAGLERTRVDMKEKSRKSERRASGFSEDATPGGVINFTRRARSAGWFSQEVTEGTENGGTRAGSEVLATSAAAGGAMADRKGSRGAGWSA